MSKSLQIIDDKNKNNVLVNTIRNALSHLKDKIETMTKIEKRSKEPDKVVNIVGKIFEFNRPNQDQQPDTTDMPDSESKESAEKRGNQE